MAVKKLIKPNVHIQNKNYKYFLYRNLGSKRRTRRKRRTHNYQTKKNKNCPKRRTCNI